MSISAYLVCHSRRLTLNLGKPLRRPGGTVTTFDQGFLQGAEREQLDRALWKFLADTAGEALVVAFDSDEDFETVAGYVEIGGDVEDGNIPHSVYLREPGVGAVPASGYSYYGVPGPDRDLIGVLRRSIVDGLPVDEAFTRSRRWEPTLRLREQELGYGDAGAVPITSDAAAAFVTLIAARPEPARTNSRPASFSTTTALTSGRATAADPSNVTPAGDATHDPAISCDPS